MPQWREREASSNKKKVKQNCAADRLRLKSFSFEEKLPGNTKNAAEEKKNLFQDETRYKL